VSRESNDATPTISTLQARFTIPTEHQRQERALMIASRHRKESEMGSRGSCDGEKKKSDDWKRALEIKEKTFVSLSLLSYLLRELGDGLGVNGLLLVVGGHGFEGCLVSEAAG